MKKLLYVPVIHTELDFGSVAGIIEKKTSDILGEDRWNRHKETVAGFWDAIADYFDALKISKLKIYQDGLVADGEIGRKIIEEGAKIGSKNHQIVLKLILRGGEIRKTEDIRLLKEEYEHIIKLTQPGSFLRKTWAYLHYKMHKMHLLQARDEFIAKRINETLKDSETGVLFIGAYHEVLPHFTKDIVAKEVKEQAKVRAYFEELIHGKDKAKFEELSKYLISPVSA